MDCLAAREGGFLMPVLAIAYHFIVGLICVVAAVYLLVTLF